MTKRAMKAAAGGISKIWVASILAMACGAVNAAGPATAPAVDLSKEKVLYVVGYAHLDTQWRWTYPQVIREFIPNTMRDNFALFEKYPHYVFNFSGSRRYEMMREYYPDDYAKVKQYVAAGRWFPCGSSVDENDANVPSAESFVRHVLYGNLFFKSEFGVESGEFMLPDCFGFPAALPSLLAHSGLKGFSTQKLTWGSAVGIPFKVGVWEGPDGKSVMAALDPGAYTGTVTENLANSETWTKRVEGNGQKSGTFTDYHYFGTGDKGGAPKEESVKFVEESVKTEDGKLKVISGPADWMFAAITPEQREKLPKYKGELLLTEHSAGSITSQAYMKRWNRKNELLADAAERASVGAMWLGTAKYPAKKLYDAWDLVLGSQMHDILPGTSHPKGYEYSWNDEVLAANQFSAVLENAVGAIAETMDTRAEGVPVVVYNALSVEREDVVEATVTFAGDAPRSVRIVGPEREEVPVQVLSRNGREVKVAFLAKLPPVGLATFDVQPGDAPAAGGGSLRVDEKSIENGRYKVTLDANGDVASVVDKANGNKELLAGPARLEFLYERPQQYPAWNMDWADRQKAPKAYVDGPAKVRVVESGPVRVALEVTREAQGSKFVQTIRLSAGGAGDRVEFDTKIDWQTKESSLKQAFPLAVSNPTATYEIQLGTVERGNNDPKKYEVPSHQWFDLTHADGKYGVSVLSDSKFGSDKPADNTLRLTLLYTPGVRGNYQDQGTQDFGRHEMVYALAGHAGDWRDGKSYVQAARVNQPLMAFNVAKHEGREKSVSLFQVSTDQVAISAVKKAEDGDGVIVRLRELSGKPAKGVRVASMGGIRSAREVDGQEREVGKAELDKLDLVVDMEPYALRAFEVRFGGAGVRARPLVAEAVKLPFDTDVASTDKNRRDGAMDEAGRTIAAEQLPQSLESEGIPFQIGSTADGEKNAVACRGQKVTLPEGEFDRVYVLAASSAGDVDAVFDIDGKPTTVKVQDWGGYVGQYDNRLWGGDVAELAFNWPYPLVGLEPGYVKPATVAWYSSHRHHPTGGNEHYRYSYMFKYRLPVAKGAKSVTLPNDPRVKVFALTAVAGGTEPATPASPLFDTLADRGQDVPTIVPAGGKFTDATPVAIRHPLYWREGNLRYTLDGSDPTKDSRPVAGPLYLTSSATVKARSFAADGTPGPVVSAQFDVADNTGPKVISASSVSVDRTVAIAFSEPVDAQSAGDAGHYRLEGAEDVKVESVKLAGDGLGAMLTLSAPAKPGIRLAVADVRDRSPAKNSIASGAVAVQVSEPVYRMESPFVATGKNEEVKQIAGLPTKATAPWTISLRVKPKGKLAARTLIAGFGAVNDEDGTGRYVTNFANGIHFWGSHADGDSRTKFDADKWQAVTFTYDGTTLRMYKNGEEIASQPVALADDEAVLRIAPVDPWDKQRRFAGEIRDLTVWNAALSADAVKLLSAEPAKAE